MNNLKLYFFCAYHNISIPRASCFLSYSRMAVECSVSEGIVSVLKFPRVVTMHCASSMLQCKAKIVQDAQVSNYQGKSV